MSMIHEIVTYIQVLKCCLPWYGALQLFGFIAWPFFFGVFNRLPDRGYAAAKAFGLLFVAYCTYLLSHSQGFSWQTVAIASGFLCLLSLARLPRVLPYLAEFIRIRWRTCLIVELLFAAAFATMVIIRSKIPQVTFEISDFAAEKFTDFAVLNSLLASPYFPPHDAWLSGFSLNYYYFGHFLWATISRFTSTGSEIGFNLGLASIFAYITVLSFSLGYNLTGRIKWGFLSAFLIVLSSNIDGAFQLLGIVREVWEGDLRLSQWYMGYDFWRSSRAIQNTITEFPSFSLILGDLHAHLSSLIIFLLGLSLCIQAWKGILRAGSLLRYESENLDELLFLALIFGALYAGNSWDVVNLGMCVGVTFWGAATNWKASSAEETPRWSRKALWSFFVAIEALLLTILLVAVGITLLFRPFYVEFLPPNATLAFLPDELKSSPLEFATHWILLLILPVLLLVAVGTRTYRKTMFGMIKGGLTREILTGTAVAACALILLGIVSGFGVVGSLTGVTALILVSVLALHPHPAGFRLFLSLLLVFCALTCFAEVAYFDDIFSGPIERINTVFKIYYGLWPIVSLAAVLAARRCISAFPEIHWKRWSRRLLVFIVIAGGIYPIAGTLQRIGMAKHYPPAKDPARVLDGMRYLSYVEPDDYAAILWIRAFTDPEARILEAPGKQYEYAGRVASNTGRPALGGWLYHEWGWRGKEFEIERDRRFDVADQIYVSSSLRDTAKLLLEDKIDYVIVGKLERERYPLLNEEKFVRLGKKVYEHGYTKVYKIAQQALTTALFSEEPEETPSLVTTSAEVPESTISRSFEHSPTTSETIEVSTPKEKTRLTTDSLVSPQRDSITTSSLLAPSDTSTSETATRHAVAESSPVQEMRVFETPNPQEETTSSRGGENAMTSDTRTAGE